MRAAASRRVVARDQSRIAALTARLRAPRGSLSLTRHASSSIMMLTRRGMVTSPVDQPKCATHYTPRVRISQAACRARTMTAEGGRCIPHRAPPPDTAGEFQERGIRAAPPRACSTPTTNRDAWTSSSETCYGRRPGPPSPRTAPTRSSADGRPAPTATPTSRRSCGSSPNTPICTGSSPGRRGRRTRAGWITESPGSSSTCAQRASRF